jgi:hypothetical protein
VAIALATLAGAALGACQEYVTLAPVRHRPQFIQITTTVGVAVVIRGITLIAFGKDPLSLPGFSYSLNLVTGTIIGGLLSIWGGALGAIIIIGLRELLRDLAVPLWEAVIMGGLTVLVLIVFPRGIAGFFGDAFDRLVGPRRSQRLVTVRPDFTALSAADAMRPSELSFGHQRLVEIARALALRPRLLLMDEPASGLNDSETEMLAELILRIAALGITVLLVEHDMRIVMGLADHVVVMDHGEKITDGPADQVRADPKVIGAYLGQEAAEHAA